MASSEDEGVAGAPERSASSVQSVWAEITHIIDDGAGPCGRVHSVAALEVEVVRPRLSQPRLGIYVSCPSDLQPHGLLDIGNTVELQLFDQAQPWPKPATRFDASITTRYVREIRRVPPLSER